MVHDMEWVTIPGGRVMLGQGGYLGESAWFAVESFVMARYPVTNAQYAPFIAAGGYTDRAWWTDRGWQIREKEGWTEPRFWTDRDWNRADYPVVGVSWYEALAFCRWLSAGSGRAITLPTEQQWQRAAQGEQRARISLGQRGAGRTALQLESRGGRDHAGHTLPGRRESVWRDGYERERVGMVPHGLGERAY